MMSYFRRLAVVWIMVMGMTAGSAALAHENHDQLGAGPGPSANAAAAAPAEKAAVVEVHTDMAAAHGEAMEQHASVADENKSFGQRLVSWLGRMHMLLVHFPIAMFVGALGVELFGLWRSNRDYQRAAQVMLVVGAIGAVAAAFLGWFAGGFYLTDRNLILMIHRWLGTAIAVAAILLLYLSATARRTPDKPRTIYWAGLGAITIAIAVQGFLGGTFMHGGINHLAF